MIDDAGWHLAHGLVPCRYPDPEVSDRLPDGFDEWRSPCGWCSHAHCLVAEDARRTMPVTETRAEREERLADYELMKDEFHGRRDADGDR